MNGSYATRESLIALYRAELEVMVDEISELRECVTNKELRLQENNLFIQSFSEEFSSLESQLARLREDHSRLIVGKKKEGLDEEIRVKSVSRAVTIAKSIYADSLYILDSAQKSAAECRFREPQLVFDTLSLLTFAARAGGFAALSSILTYSLGRRAKYKPKDSPQTLSAFPKSRDFKDRTGCTRTYSRHITLGHGERTTHSAHIYFDFIPGGFAEVAYIGTHLPTVKVNT